MRLIRFFWPISVRAGVFHVTARTLRPYSRHLTTCAVLSLPPLTGTTQSYPFARDLTSLTISSNSRFLKAQSISSFSLCPRQAVHIPLAPILMPGRVSGRTHSLQYFIPSPILFQKNLGIQKIEKEFTEAVRHRISIQQFLDLFSLHQIEYPAAGKDVISGLSFL